MTLYTFSNKGGTDVPASQLDANFAQLLASIEANFGTITDHIDNTSNPHAVTTAQIGAQPVNSTLTLLSGLIPAANAIPYFDGSTNPSTLPVATFTTRIEAEINVLDYGAVGDGVTDDRAAFLACVAAAAGRTIRIPMTAAGGTYMFSAVFSITVSVHVSIKMDPGVTLKAASGFAAGQKLFYFLNSTPGLQLKAYVEGGTIDGTNIPNSAPGEANDTASVVGPAYSDICLTRVRFICGTSRTTGGSDSLLFIASCAHVRVRDCTFQGAPDSAIYISGDGTSAYGSDIEINGCNFGESVNGVIAKREFRYYRVNNNFFENCDVGIATGEADVSQLPGKYMIASGNEFHKVRQPILARISNGFLIQGNKSVDHGYDASGSPVANQAAITIQGASYGVCIGNSISMEDYATYSTQYGIYSQRRTFNAVNYDCHNNTIALNTIDGIYNGVYSDANASINSYLYNSITNFTNRMVLNETNPTVQYNDPAATNGSIINSRRVSLGGDVGNESLRIINTANGVNYVQISGSVTGNSSGPIILPNGSDTDIPLTLSAKGAGNMYLGGAASLEALRLLPGISGGNCFQITPAATGSYPILSARGADTNIDFGITPKGTGLVRFGTWTSSADAAINGYITVKDAAGNSRKLATIA